MNFELITNENSFDKFRVELTKLHETLKSLRDDAVYDFDRLNTIVAVDLGVDVNQFEIIYDLYSSKTSNMGQVSVLVDRNSPHVPSIVDVYKSAYFDECEIYDMFGIVFDKNPDLKRLLMPKGWKGNPLRKDYKQDDERLKWNEDAC